MRSKLTPPSLFAISQLICGYVIKDDVNFIHLLGVSFVNITYTSYQCEIFDRSDLHDFYTIKSRWEADCGVKIIFFKYLEIK
jgi:hypothetical protein